MKKMLPLCALIALAGCAPHPVATIYCVTPTQVQQLKDAEPKRVGDKLTGQSQIDLKIIAERTVLLESWGEGLLGVLSGCSGN